MIPVSAHVCRELPLPVASVRCWGRRTRTPVVAMPEAAMDKADRPVAGEDKVRPARKRGIVELVAEAAGVKCAPQGQLGPGVPASDSGHDARTSRAVEGVRHSLLPARPSRRRSLGGDQAIPSVPGHQRATLLLYSRGCHPPRRID